MQETPADETIELAPDRWILLVFGREWPRYIVEWSVRQRHGDSDFPTLGGRVVQEPDSSRSAEELWSEARERAIEEANSALAQAAERQGSSRKGLLARIFGRPD